MVHFMAVHVVLPIGIVTVVMGCCPPPQDSGSYPPPYAADKSQEGTKRPVEAAVAVRVKN